MAGERLGGWSSYLNDWVLVVPASFGACALCGEDPAHVQPLDAILCLHHSVCLSIHWRQEFMRLRFPVPGLSTCNDRSEHTLLVTSICVMISLHHRLPF